MHSLRSSALAGVSAAMWPVRSAKNCSTMSSQEEVGVLRTRKR